MRTTELKALLEVVEALREDLHPDLDKAFLQAVVRAEQENPDDEEEALRAITAALKPLLAKRGR
jgi:hypothetical protein